MERWERKLFLSGGSWKVTLPKPLVDNRVRHSAAGAKAIFSYSIDERQGRAVITMEIVPESEKENGQRSARFRRI